MRRILRGLTPGRPLRRAGAVVLIVALAFVAGHVDVSRWLDDRTADARAAVWRHAPVTDITLVDIDAASLAETGVWPWPRDIHARLLDQANALGARAVAFDIDFSAASDPAGDAAFAAALARSRAETFLAVFQREARVGAEEMALSRPIDAFLERSWPAGVNVPLAADGRVRQFSAGLSMGAEPLEPMPALLAGVAAPAETFGIDASIDPAAIPRISYVDLLAGRADPTLVEGRALLVGASAIELRDVFRVPVYGLVSGSTVIALAAETLAQGRAQIGLAVPSAAFGFLAVLAAFAALRLRNRTTLALLALTALGVEAFALVLQHRHGLVLRTGSLHLALAGLLALAVLRAFDLRKLLLAISVRDAGNSRRMFERVVEDGFDGILILDPEGRVLRANEAARALPLSSGRPGVPERLDGFPDSVRRTLAGLAGAKEAAAGRATHDAEIATADGTVVLEYTATALRLEKETPSDTGAPHVCLTFRDVTQARRTAERMRRMALQDALTGLANRRALEAELSARSARGEGLALALFDLDRFKGVNDRLGHGVGDLVLAETAARAVEALGPAGLVARIGGDEFAAVMPADDAMARAERLAAAVAVPFRIAGHRIAIGTSVGLATGAGRVQADRLLHEADLALNVAKRSSGTRRVVAFDASMETGRHERLEIESALSEALEHGEFRLVYQPQVDLRTGALVGAEALVRWLHPSRGAISPSIFVPVAEETGLIHRLGEWVLAEAMREAVRWPHPLRVAVNVSSVQFEAGDLSSIVARTLAASGLEPGRLELEITESAFVRDSESLDAMFATLSALGIAFALDDFGTGYSSLGYLHRFPISKIKIDKSFVDGLPTSGHAMAIVRSITALAGGLSMRTVAEGIETALQAECLSVLGCRDGQGYLYSPPLEAADFLAFAGGRTVSSGGTAAISAA